jgi:hypothetical protein
MQFGIASTSQGFGFDGILGIGPRDLTCALKNLPESILPTVTDCLFQQRNIREPVPLSVSFSSLRVQIQSTSTERFPLVKPTLTATLATLNTRKEPQLLDQSRLIVIVLFQ